MIPATYTLPDVYRGDTAEEVPFRLLRGVDPMPIDLTGCKVMMEMILQNGSVKKVINETSGIDIYSPTEGMFKIQLGIVDVPPGVYDYDIEFTFPHGAVKTYLAGTITVIADKTNR